MLVIVRQGRVDQPRVMVVMIVIMIMMMAKSVCVIPLVTVAACGESLRAFLAEQLRPAEAEHAIAAPQEHRRDLGDDAQGEEQAEKWRVARTHDG